MKNWTSVSSNNILIITNHNDIVSNLNLYETITLFGSKKNNYYILKIKDTYDNSVQLILEKIKSIQNNDSITIIASSYTTIFLTEAISRLNVNKNIKKLIIISPHSLCYHNIIKLKNLEIDIIYGEKDEIVPINSIESLSYKSKKHVLYCIKSGNHSLSNINLNKFNCLILTLLRN